MAECLLGLGSNVGDRAAQLDQCVSQLCGHPQIHLLRVSRYHETAPIGGPQGQGRFLNAAVRISTELAPVSLLAWSRSVEQSLGRRRVERWGPRVIDIDLLLYDQLICETDTLALPHPRMAVRRFVLQPASEIAADMIHAPTGWSLARLLARLDEPPCYVAVAGASDSARARLVTAASARVEAVLLSSGTPPPSAIVQPGDGGEGSGMAAELILQRELGRVSRQRRLLAAIRTGPPSLSPLILSDFWLDQALAVASTWPPGLHRTRLEQACRRAMAEAPRPRFVLLLDTTAEARARNGAETASTDLERGDDTTIEALAGALRRQAARPGQAPILRVRNGERGLVELIAAVDAMR